MNICKECQEEQELIKRYYYDLEANSLTTTLNNWKCTVDEDGLHHSFNGESAWIDSEGTEMWLNHGLLHREGAPAEIWANGWVEWYINDDHHREDGPCIYSTKYEYGMSDQDCWCWQGQWAQEIYEPLYVNKVLEFTQHLGHYQRQEQVGVVCEKINQYFYRVLCGNKKILIVDLSNWDKKSTISEKESLSP